MNADTKSRKLIMKRRETKHGNYYSLPSSSFSIPDSQKERRGEEVRGEYLRGRQKPSSSLITGIQLLLFSLRTTTLSPSLQTHRLFAAISSEKWRTKRETIEGIDRGRNRSTLVPVITARKVTMIEGSKRDQLGREGTLSSTV